LVDAGVSGRQLPADTATVLVRVAPGEKVRVSPHPSGVPSMPPLELHSHATLRVTPQHADQLYHAGQIYHPQTGMLPVQGEPRGMSVLDADGRRIDPLADVQNIRAGGRGALEDHGWQKIQCQAAEESAARRSQYGDGEGRLQPTITSR
jgi:hypothetical protein